MAIAKGTNVRVEIGLTESASKTVSAVSQSNPGRATSTAHGLAEGSVGYFDDVVNMSPLDGQAVRVLLEDSPTDANTFDLEGVDTSGFPSFTSGVFVPVATWSTLSQSTQYQLGGGAPNPQDSTTLLDTTAQQEIVLNAPETVTIDMRALTEENQALTKIRSCARSKTMLVFRITLDDGAQRVFRGQPSLPGESLTQGGLGTGQLTVTVKGQICYLNAL